MWTTCPSFGLRWTILFITSLSSISGLPLSCSFASDFCGWTPSAVGGSWTRFTGSGSVNGVKPPSGRDSFAYVLSAEESYAELESDQLTLIKSTIIRFKVYQARSEYNTDNPMVQLISVPSDGSLGTVLWSIKRAQFNWNPVVAISLNGTQNFRLRFRFRVGSTWSTAAIADIVVDNEDAFMSPETPTTLANAGSFQESTELPGPVNETSNETTTAESLPITTVTSSSQLESVTTTVTTSDGSGTTTTAVKTVTRTMSAVITTVTITATTVADLT